MEVHATLRRVRMSCKKVRLVLDSVRGMETVKALVQLSVSPKLASKHVEKLVSSAMANAEHNFKLDKDNLYIKSISADQGAVMKRWRPRAFGRAAPIRKHTCHINITLGEIKETKPLGRVPKKKVVKEKVDVVLEKPKDTIQTGVQNEAVEPGMQASEDNNTPFDVTRKGKHRHQQHQDPKMQRGEGGSSQKIFNRKVG